MEKKMEVKERLKEKQTLKPELKSLKPELKKPENAKEAQVIADSAINEVTPVLQHAKEIEVTDQATYDVAMEGAAKCSRARARVEEVFGNARDLANKTHKAITSAIKSLVDPLKQAETFYGNKAYRWNQAETARLEAEEIARQKKEEADQKEENLNVASFLDAAGAHDEADILVEEEVHIAPRQIFAPAKPAGVSTRENFQWKCTDLRALVAAVYDGKVGLSVLTTADTVITKMVKALKHEAKLPGIKVWDTGTTSVKKKA